MKEMIKKILTNKTARSATALSSIMLATGTVFTPWGCC